MVVKTQEKSICRFCTTSCPIVVDLEDGRPVRVTGNKASPSYDGFCCTRGQAVPEQIANPNRLLHSLKMNEEGVHERIDAVAAMDEVSAKVRDIVERHGPRSVAVYLGTYSAPYPATAPIAAAWTQALGSPMLFTSMTIDQPGKDIAAAMIGGWEAGPHMFDGSDVWMVVGANPLVSIGLVIPKQNPARRLTDALARGMKLIVIDPRRTQTAHRAHVHLQPRPGEDATLLAAMIHVILAENLHDAAFAQENVMGVDALRRAVEPFTPAFAAQRADVPAEDIVLAARTFAKARRGLAAGATGANMSGRSSLNEYLIQCLNTICGRFVREGEKISTPGVMIARATPKAQPRPPRPAYGLGETMAVRGLGRAASGMPTAALADEILAGKVKALFSVGGNPATAWPDQNRTIAALKKLDMFVQFDIVMSASARLAQYVIAPKIAFEVPTLSYGIERIEIYHSIFSIPEPFGFYAPAFLDPPAGSDLVEEWEFFWGMATRLGLQLRLHFPNSTTATKREERPPVDLDMSRQPTTDELFEVMTTGSRIPLSEVKKYPDGKIFDEEILVAPKDPDCTARLDVGNVEMMTELGEVAAAATLEARYGAEFPYLLLCRRAPHVLNSGGQGLPLLIRKGGRYNPAYMNPDDLALLGLKPGDEVQITSPHGQIPGIVDADPALRRGTVSMTHSFGDLPDREAEFRLIGSNTSQLTSVEDDYDRYSGIPRMSAVPVRVAALTPAQKPCSNSAK
jgi:anaerobic selenocysteine-containing dehydrogenase